MNNPNENQKSLKENEQEEKIAHPLGKSYDFWQSEEDSIYDELYGEEI